MKQTAVVFLSALLFLGCEPEERTVDGRMGYGDFTYICGAPADANCNARDELFSSDSDALVPIAVGGLFDFASNDEDFAVVAVLPDSLNLRNGSVRFNTAGPMDFLAINDDGEVLDIATLESEDVAGIAVFDDGARVSELHHGGTRLEIAAAPISGSGAVLGGGFRYNWSSTGDVLLRDDDDDSTVSVSVYPDGSGTITVSVGDWSTTVTVQD